MKKNLILTFLSILFTFIVIEGLIRIYLPQSDRFYQPDLHLGSRLKSNFTGWWYGEYFKNDHEFANQVVTNNLGFHDSQHTFQNQDGTRRVVILGDSFIEALQVNRADHSGKVLEKALNSNYGKWEVVSLARAGNSTAEEIVLWEEWGKKFQAEYVVIVFSKNDLLENERLSQSSLDRPRFWIEGENLYRSGPIITQRSFIQEKLADSSHLVRFLSRFRIKHQQRLQLRDQGEQKALEEISLNLTTKLMNYLLVELKQSQVKPMVIFIDDNPVTREKIEPILSILNKNQVPFSFFGNKDQPQNRENFFPIDGHLTSKGHTKLAQQIYQLFLKHYL